MCIGSKDAQQGIPEDKVGALVPVPDLPEAQANNPKKPEEETPTPVKETAVGEETGEAAGDSEEDGEADGEDEDEDEDDEDGDDGEDGDDEDDRDSEYCPFCEELNYWGEMEVCKHHIGMEFDGMMECEELDKLQALWMSLAGKLEQLGEFTQKKLAETSGASPKTIRLFLRNVEEGHEGDLYPKDLFPDIFGLEWGGMTCQTSGMLGSNATSIYCKNYKSLTKHIANLELLDKAFPKKNTDEGDS